MANTHQTGISITISGKDLKGEATDELNPNNVNVLSFGWPFRNDRPKSTIGFSCGGRCLIVLSKLIGCRFLIRQTVFRRS